MSEITLYAARNRAKCELVSCTSESKKKIFFLSPRARVKQAWYARDGYLISLSISESISQRDTNVESFNLVFFTRDLLSLQILCKASSFQQEKRMSNKNLINASSHSHENEFHMFLLEYENKQAVFA